MRKNTKSEISYEPNNFVLVQNDIINSFFSCSTYQLRLILMAVAKSMNNIGKEKNPRKVTFTVKEFFETMGMNLDGRVRKNLFENIQSASQLQIKIISDKKRAWVNWFEYVTYEESDNNQLKFCFTQTVFDVLKVIGQKFTKLDFSVIGKGSFYAIRWYMMAREMMYLKGKGGNEKNKWTVMKTFDQIRQEMNIDESTYQDRTNNFLKFVVKGPIEELNKINTEFKIGSPDKLFTKIKNGRNTIGIMIECNTDINTVSISNFDNYEQKQTKLAINNEEQFIQKYKTEYETLFDQESKNPSIKLPFDNDLFRKARVLTILAQKHPIVAKKYGINITL